MNIVFVYTKQADSASGGIQRITVLTLEALRARGHRCFYLQDTSNLVFYDNRAVVNVRDFFVNNEIDVIVQQHPYPGCVVRCLQEHRLNIPFVVVWHTAPVSIQKSWRVAWSQKYNLNGRIKRFFRVALFPWFAWKESNRFYRSWKSLLPLVSRVVVLSESFFEDFEKLLPSCKHKLVAIPNFLSFDKNISMEEMAKKEKMVLVVARMKEQQKKISFVFKIWKILQNKRVLGQWKLVLVGQGEDAAGYQKLTKKMNLKQVEFVGKQDSLPYYRKASIFMMTSAFEGWGLTLTESLQMGVVPIAMDSYKSLRDILTDGKNGIVVPYGDICRFAEKMQELMNDSELRERLARQGIQSSLQFSRGIVIDRWENLFISLIK